MRRALKPFAYVAALAPFLLPRPAHAATTISAGTTAPIATSSAGDITVTSSGSVLPTAGPTAVTMDSGNAVTNQGSIGFRNVDNSTALLIDGGNGALSNSASIANSESYTATDTNGDGFINGAFAQGANRFGVRVATPFVGSITQTAAGAVTVEGNNSAAIEIDGAMTGDLNLQGSISAIGSNAYGLRTTAPITGSVFFMGSGSALGDGAKAISLEGSVSGGVHLQSTITNTGYRFTARPTDAALALLTADEKQQSGAAVTVSGDVGAGVLLDVAPTLSSGNPDVDGDGVADNTELNSSITQLGTAPALQIGGAGPITIGNVGTGALAYGLVNKGTITASGLLDDVSATAVEIDGADLTGGASNTGTITANSYDAGSSAVSVGAGSALAAFDNTGSVLSNLTINKAVSSPVAYGLTIASGATVSSLTNSGSIVATVLGANGVVTSADAVAIRDLSDSLHTITNSGVIKAQHGPVDELDVNLVTGRNVAIDLSTQTGGTAISQIAPAPGADAPQIVGDILLGSGADTLDIQAGTVTGDVTLGGGADRLLISGGSALTGNVTETGSALMIDVSDGRLNLLNDGALTGASAHFGANSVLALRLDPTAGLNGSLNLTGAAAFDAGSKISVLLRSAVPGDVGDFTLVHAGGGVTGSPPVTLADTPILYSATVTEPPSSPDDISVHLVRRTASDPALGLNRNEAALYEPFFAAAQTDSGEMQSFLGISTAPSLRSALDQLMPNATGAELDYAQTRNEALTSLLFSRYTGGEQPDRQIYAWVHELGYTRDRDQTFEGQGYHGYGFGFAAGVDGPMGQTGYKGFGVSITSDQISEQSGFDHPLNVISAELMAHAVQPLGGLLFGGRIGAAYDRFSSKRLIQITPDLVDAPALNRDASASWNGAHISGSLHAAYPGKLGAIRITPDVGVDGVYMWEGGYNEHNAGDALDLTVGARQGLRADASAAVTFGLPFQTESFLFTPSFTLGARQPLAAQAFETPTQFGSGAQFTLESETLDTPALIAGLALNATGELGSFRIEAQSETRSGEVSASGRVVLRLTF